MRDDVMSGVSETGGYTEAGLKKQIMVDRSAPVVGGQYVTLSRYVDMCVQK